LQAERSLKKAWNKRWRQALLKQLKPIALHACTPEEELSDTLHS
jgi:hypothetical protein